MNSSLAPCAISPKTAPHWTAMALVGLAMVLGWAGCRWAETPPPPPPLTLVRDGEAAAVIVLAQEPTRAAQLAAYELQWHVEQITGARLPIAREPVAGMIAIHVGNSPTTRAAGLDDWLSQEYAIKFLDDAIILAGEDAPGAAEVKYDFADPFAFRTWPGLFEPQGTLHAVYVFLERHGNVRWWNPTEHGLDIPRTPTLTVNGADLRQRPAFSYRDLGHIAEIAEGYDAGTQLWHPDDPEFERYLDLAYPAMRAQWGANRWHWIHGKRGWTRLWLMRQRLGGSERYRANHSFYNYYERFRQRDHANFESDHPEYFAQGYEDRAEPPQLCYSHPGVVAQVVADARDYFDHGGYRRPMRGIGAPGYQWFEDYFAVVPMDNSSYCRCDACRAQFNAAEADSPFFSNGQWSNYLFGFANQVARELKQTHPDKHLATLAYASYAKYPAGVRIEENIAVQVCLHIRNMYDVAMQRNDEEILASWTEKERNRRIFLWLYYCFPWERGRRSLLDGKRWHVFPGFCAHHLGESFRSYHRQGVRGTFFNGFGQEVEAYVTFRMLQDPGESVPAILDEYFSRHYGAAGEPLKQFYLTVEDIYCDPANYVVNERGRVGHQTWAIAWGQLGTAARMDALAEFMAEAHRRAGTEEERQRLAIFDLTVWQYMRRAVHETTTLPPGDLFPDHPATITRILGRPPELTDNALRDKPFVLETPGTLLIAEPHAGVGVPFPHLTDGRDETIFVHGGSDQAIAFRCDLDAPPAAGRELRQIRLVWSIADSARCRAACQFEVRDASTGAWRTITPVLASEERVSLAGSHRVLDIPFPAGAVTGFDAIRLLELSATRGWHTTRLIEVEAQFANSSQASRQEASP